MKIAITGKGGVGKTTLSALLSFQISAKGKRVIAVDADPDSNLASALGFSDIDKIIPISEMEHLIEERTGAKPGSSGSFFKINPKVDDLPDKVSIQKDNIRLMVMGTVKKGGAGCVCPESVLLKTLITHLVLFQDDVVIMDMEAGIEHLGRGTATGVDMLIIVVEPGMRSIDTAVKINSLANDLKVKRVAVVGNKIRKSSDEEFIRENINSIEILGFLPYNNNLIDSDMKGIPALSLFSERIEQILEKINS
ncbi:MAG: carbon monoxide dehydrogenase accessory protein CooC [Spirochaetota bacterium]|nr:carbon monoxide dehydrogenase accessory protein CooC [Spirochaetota bacterium]